MKVFAMMWAAVVLTLASCSGPGEPVTNETAEPATRSAGTEVATTDTVTLEIPSMHCPFACWPKVKKTLEAEQGVGTVTLADQKSDSAIDNPVVHVKVGNGFDTSRAIASLSDAGFKDAEVKATP